MIAIDLLYRFRVVFGMAAVHLLIIHHILPADSEYSQSGTKLRRKINPPTCQQGNEKIVKERGNHEGKAWLEIQVEVGHKLHDCAS